MLQNSCILPKRKNFIRNLAICQRDFSDIIDVLSDIQMIWLQNCRGRFILVGFYPASLTIQRESFVLSLLSIASLPLSFFSSSSRERDFLSECNQQPERREIPTIITSYSNILGDWRSRKGDKLERRGLGRTDRERERDIQSIFPWDNWHLFWMTPALIDTDIYMANWQIDIFVDTLVKEFQILV